MRFIRHEHYFSSTAEVVSEKGNFTVDDIVLVVHENSPRSQWPLDRVVETFADKIGFHFVRSIKIHTSACYYARPISKLCLMEGDASDNNSVQEKNIEVDNGSTLSVANQDFVPLSGTDGILGQHVNPFRRSTRITRAPVHLQEFNRHWLSRIGTSKMLNIEIS